MLRVEGRKDDDDDSVSCVDRWSGGGDGWVHVRSRRANTRADMSQAPGIVPSGLGDAVDRDVAKVREATARFKTAEAAEAAGYKRVTDCVENQPAGAMGYHFQNNALLDTTLDVDHPEVLVYEKKADGTFKLNGVEFLVPIPAWKSRRAATHHGTGPQEGGSPGDLVPARVDVGIEPQRSLFRLESQGHVRGHVIEASRDAVSARHAWSSQQLR